MIELFLLVMSVKKIPPFEKVFTDCEKLGAKFEPAIFLNESGKFSCGGGQEVVKKVEIVVYRKLYLLCTGGVNRSQGLWRVASKQIPPENLEKPHGAVKAHDPFFTSKISNIDGKGIDLKDLGDSELEVVQRNERFGKVMRCSDLKKSIGVK